MARPNATEPPTAVHGAVPPVGAEPRVRNVYRRMALAEARGWAITFALIVVFTLAFLGLVRAGFFVARMPTGAGAGRRGAEPGEDRGR